VGIGLGFELQRAEFSLNSDVNATMATVRIDGKERPEWQFQLHYLNGSVPHVVCVALGKYSILVQC
jgi:hypothetical protein